jgi:hypothetical protein
MSQGTEGAIKKSGFIVAVYLLLTFLSGVALGSLGFWLYSTRTVTAVNRRPTPEEFRRQYLNEMKTRLALNEEQTQKLVIILDNTRELFRQLRAKHQPELQAVQQNQVDQIRAILDEHQRTEYEKMRQERNNRRREKDKGFPP